MALTNAEKQARFRAKRDAELEALRKAVGKGTGKPAKPGASKPAPDDSAALKAAQAEIARLKAELAKGTAPSSAKPASATDEGTSFLNPADELVILRHEFDSLKAMLAAKREPAPGETSKEAALRIENDRLRELAREMTYPRSMEEWDARKRLHQATKKHEAKLAREAARAAEGVLSSEDEKTLTEKLANAERQLKGNATTIKNLKQRLSYFRNAPPRISKKLHKRILTLIHPDRVHRDDPLYKKLESAFQDFTACEFKYPDED